MNPTPYTEREILKAVHTAQALGVNYIMEQLQDREPALAGFVAENLQQLKEELLTIDASSSNVEEVLGRIHSFMLACVLLPMSRQLTA